MNIGIFGSGRIGSAAGSLLAEAGHDVVFGGRDTAKLAKLDRTRGGPGKAGTLSEAVAHGEAVLLTVHFRDAEALLDPQEFAGKIVIDAMNPYSLDGRPFAPPGAHSAAEVVAALLPQAQVVKAFNTLYAGILEGMLAGSPSAEGVVMFYSGDDDRALGIVSSLIRDTGFVPLLNGGLRDAFRQEPLGQLYNRPMQIDEARATLASLVAR